MPIYGRNIQIPILPRCPDSGRWSRWVFCASLAIFGGCYGGGEGGTVVLLCSYKVCAEGVEELIVGFLAAVAADYGGPGCDNVPETKVSVVRSDTGTALGDAGRLQ